MLKNGNTCLIMAEAGINHGGNFDCAAEMIRQAAEAGADIIKFQTISKETTYNFAKREGNIVDFIEKASLTSDQYKKLKEISEKNNILFLSSAADIPAAKQLNKLGIGAFKVSSGNFTNYHLINHIMQYNIPIILSTGMSDIQEIEETYEFIKRKGFDGGKISFLYCVSEYPTKFGNIRFPVMQEMINRFPDITIGFSDHSKGMMASLVAVSLGAKIIEKHFTLDRSLKGPDQGFSLEPKELKGLVHDIRIIEKILSTDEALNSGEDNNKITMRRSLYANRDLGKDEILGIEDVAAKRPFNANGISPKMFEEVVGKKLKRNLKCNELLESEFFY